jgi:hypothetical protein
MTNAQQGVEFPNYHAQTALDEAVKLAQMGQIGPHEVVEYAEKFLRFLNDSTAATV